MRYPSTNFDEALAALLAGTLGEDEGRALGLLLRSDAAARRAYLWQTELHARLLTRDEGSGLPLPRATDRPAVPRRRLLSRVALAASFSLAAGIALLIPRPPGFAPVTAEVIEASGGNRFREGERLSFGELRFAKGSLRLRLENGVILDCAAPMRARFESVERLQLDFGRMNVDASVPGEGFTVITREGEVVDLGTAFSVEASEAGPVRVAVFSGKVELRPKNAASADLYLGDAAQLHRGREPRRVQSLPVVQQGESARLDLHRPRHSLISSISDNLQEGSTRRFYGIVAGGMVDKARAFTDRSGPVWKAAEGSAFPADLAGADLVQTMQEQRWERGFEMSLVLERPATVYVIHDPRNAAPSWLERDFVKTPLRLRCGSWSEANITAGLEPGANGRYHIPFEVWKREVAGVGTIHLGGPYDPSSPVPSSMYGIAVKALPQS